MERRYQDHEIRQILDLALREGDAPAQTVAGIDGLTLRELQEVGREVGLTEDRVTQAVAAFEAHAVARPRGTTLGLPTTVGSIVTLPRSPSDREWELLIAELRTTFGGKGVVTSSGGLREWSHGTVHAFVEPTETGHRLRLADSNATTVGRMALGGFFLAFALLLFVILLGKDDPGVRFALPVFFSLIGGSLVAGTVVALPRWAREQEKRMEHISSRAISLLAPPGPTGE